MNLPDKEIQDFLDGLTRTRSSFALYRLPWTDTCHFVWQTTGTAERLADICALNGKRGFVIAPFRLSEAHPLVLIRPDVAVREWEGIGRAMKANPLLRPAGTEGGIRPDAALLHRDPAQEKESYTIAFNRFIHPLQEKRFRKLVLSRAASRPAGKEFSPLRAFVRACNCYPRMMIYLCHTPDSGTWIGSTPEILLSGHGEEWHTVALAGTMPMQDEVMPTLWNGKNREEQACVAEYIRRIVQRFGCDVAERGPYTARAGQLVHLKTDFRFLLKSSDRLGDLLQELHPTPAVCGLPKEEAFRFIADNEGYDRRYYSGFIGWLDPAGVTNLYVNLRCMEVAGNEVRFYAGGGILVSSEVESEWEETGEKMKTMQKASEVEPLYKP